MKAGPTWAARRTPHEEESGDVAPVPDHHRPGGGFRNPWLPDSSHRFWGFLKWAFIERPFNRLPRDPPASVFSVVESAIVQPRASSDQLRVTWVGHSTTLLQLGDCNILTDPIWSERASPLGFIGPKRWVRPGVEFDALPPIDVVVISHNHYDHLDNATTRRLARAHPNAQWLVPLGVASFVEARGVQRVMELDWWRETTVGSLRVACTPAQHFSGRGLADRNATLWCGWALRNGSGGVLFGGDSGYHREFSRIAERYGPFKAVLLPVGAYEPAWFMRSAHMNPEEAVRTYIDLVAANDSGKHDRTVMVPIHFGTFKLTDEAMDEPPGRTERAWQTNGLPRQDLWLLNHGETRTLS